MIKENLILKIDTTPKLQNGYGDLFEYKNSSLANLATERIHQKRLNLEREISKHRIQKKNEKSNFYKFKNQTKTSYSSNSTSLKLKYIQDKNEIQEILKYKDKLLPFAQFISKKIKIKENELKVFRKNTLKTLKSIQYSDEPDQVIENKIINLKNEAIKKEDFFLEVIKFFKQLQYNNTLFDAQNDILTREIKEQVFKLLDVSFSQNKNYLFNEFESLYKAFRNQHFFIYHDKNEDFESKLVSIKQKYLQDKKNLKQEYLSLLKQEKENIKNKFIQAKKNSKTIFNKTVEQIKLKDLNSEQKQLDIELKKQNHQRKLKIKEIKATEKKLYYQKVKQYKKNNKISYSFWTDKKTAILNAEKKFSFSLVLNKNLASINKWKYKLDLKELKSNYLKSLGTKLQELTYDGQYFLNNAIALHENNLKKQKNYLNFVNEVKNLDSFSSCFEKLSDQDQIDYDEKVQSLTKKLQEDIAELKLKVTRKEITRQAYRIQKMKLKIFYDEDIKAIKLNLDTSKKKYLSKDVVTRFYKQKKLLQKELLQEKNKISKEVPIEYKKNNSIWMSVLALFFPGIDSLILKKWKKAAFFIFISAIVWIFLIPYAFGQFNIKGNGIFGLIRLSWPTGVNSAVYGQVFSDSRYALVEGVISLLILVLSISYLVVSAYQCFKITRAMEKGIRPNTWVETKKILRTSGFPYAISIPGFVLICFIVIMPIIVSLLLAFTNIGTNHNPAGGQETNWVGLEQFKELFSNKEFFRPFGNVLWWNIVWALSTTILVLSIGTIMALAIENRNIKAKALWRTIFILPWAIPAFLSILFFKVIFGDSDTSFLNSFLQTLGMNTIKWHTDAIMSRIILILIQGWLGHSYVVLLISGYMKSIPHDIYESALIDRAKPWKQFMKMTLPIVLIQIAPLLIGQFTFNFNNFSIIWLFNDGGAKIDSTYVYDVGNCDIILSWIFKITFSAQAINITSNQALASALVIVMSIFIVSASGIGFARSKAFRKGEEI